MTPQEAIDVIKIAISEVEWDYPMSYAAAFETAVEALEKQIEKKPNKSDSGFFYLCPNCERFVHRHENSHGNIDIPYCKMCGQALNWSGENNA